MRQSDRLKDSETSLKLKDEQFIFAVATEEDEEYVEESEFIEEVFDNEEKTPTSPKKMKKRGRPKKLATKLEVAETGTSEEVDKEDLNLIKNEGIIKKRGRPRKNAPKPEITENSQDTKPNSIVSFKSPKNITAKKKINRNGPYVPPLENLNTNLLSSCEDWKSFFEDENPRIKRKNRRYKTVILPSIEILNVDKMITMSSYRLINEKVMKRPLKLLLNNKEISLINDDLIINGKIGNLNIGNSINSIYFCKCIECKRGSPISKSDKILLYAVSPERISIISTEISKKEGIKSIKEIGKILPPKFENFKTVCVVESILSISTDNSIYFLNCEIFHQKEIEIILEKGHQIISESSNLISCHSWKGKNIAIGTISGRVHVFNYLLEEIYQISIKSDSMICSLDWRDDFTILIGGNFSKIFSIDLRDPFIIETEVSTLGKKKALIFF